MKSDSSEKSESCCEDSDEDTKDETIISSTSNPAEYQPASYEHIEENIYLIDKKKHINKEVRRMTCECYTELDDDKDVPVIPCGENCLNRLLMIECNHRCSCGDRCTNKRFQQGCKVKIEVFKTEKKGCGLKTFEDLDENQFVMEYCGEVMNYRDFQSRAERYDRQKRRHYYFMTLRADEIIDATFKGSLSRFVNHSCEPNCITQKWTVNGLLRIGFFTLRKILAGEELTFDYQLQRYGKVAQTCYCEAPSCRGIIGGEKHTPLKNTVEKIVTPSTSSPRRRKKFGRSLVTDFDAVSIEEELERVIGDHHGMTHNDQALNLSRLMVRAETTPQRIMLLKVLQNTTDQNCLKAFLRYQGLSLLWSWMVDAGAKPTTKLQYELLATLKYLPVTNKNQLEDSKVIKVVNKWASKEMPEQEMPSSCSSQEETTEDMDRTLTQDDLDSSLADRNKKRLGYEQVCSPGSCGKGLPEDEVTNTESERSKAFKAKADKSPDDMSEDETKSTEDEHSLASEEDGDVGPLAYDLLKHWSSLKEIYRIPKKSWNKKQAEVVVATSSTEAPAVINPVDREQSVVVSQPDSSGSVEDLLKPAETGLSITPPPLMSLEVPIKSHGDPSSTEATQLESASEQGPTLDEWKSISSTSQDACSSQDKAIPTISPEGAESRHQVFGYKQRMGNGIGEQGFGSGYSAHGPSPGKSKKHGKKSKWKQNLLQLQLQQGSPQTIASNINPANAGYTGTSAMNTVGNNPQGSNWQGHSQQWQKASQEQGPSYFGSNPIPFQQGQFSQPHCSIPPPNMALPPNFHRNIPPPNFPAQAQPLPFASPPYQRPLPTIPLTTGLPGTPPISRYPNPQQVLPPQQNVFVPTYPPPQVPFQSYSTQGSQQVQYTIPQVSDSPAKRGSAQPEGFPEGFAKELSLSSQQGIRVNDSRAVRPSSQLSPVKPKKPTSNLPSNWKTASDPQGNVYYYHTVTRKTQWEAPKEEEFDMDLDSPSDEEPSYKRKKPRTPPGTPPRSPTLTFTTAPADTTQHRGFISMSPGQFSLNPDGQKQKMKDIFRMKLSNVIVNCLNPYYKVDCKQGRITNADDFKYLARRLTHGIMMKELQHVKSEETLQCNDSVKVKTKDYIRSYMKKYDLVYKRT